MGVPHLPGNVAESPTDEVAAALRLPIPGICEGHISHWKLGSTHGGYVLTTRRKVHRQGLLLGAANERVSIAVGRAAVARRNDHGLALTGGLGQYGVEARIFRRSKRGLATAVAYANDRRSLVGHCELDGVEHVIVRVVAYIDEIDGRAIRNGAGVFQVQIGFAFIAGPDGCGTCVGNERSEEHTS